MKAKVPRTPPGPLTRQPEDVVPFAGALWRVHRTYGRHALPWNALRHFGPVEGQRFDPHPPPARVHTDTAVGYAAADIPTAIAEAFQTGRAIPANAAARYALTGWLPARPLQLLDLTGTWPLRSGASSALTAAPRPVCRAWSRVIAATWPDLDGLLTRSTMTGRLSVVLYLPAEDSFPTAPSFSHGLAVPEAKAVIAAALRATGYSRRPSR